MQIRIGKTLLEFQNIGQPVDEDTADVDRQRSIPPSSMRNSMSPAKAAAEPWPAAENRRARRHFGGRLRRWLVGVHGHQKFRQHWHHCRHAHQSAQTRQQSRPQQLLRSETDEGGDPKEFQVQKGSPEVIISVTSDAERPGDKPEPQRHGLQISKGGAKKLLTPTVVETRDPIAISPEKTYEISGWMRNEADGIYGMRITWIEGERTLTENPIVLKGQQAWGKEAKTATRTPPAWATHARVGVFVQGKEARPRLMTSCFKEKNGSAQTPPSVKNAGIALQFEGANGAFSVASRAKVSWKTALFASTPPKAKRRPTSPRVQTRAK